MSDSLRDRLLDEMRSIRTVDCHSHTALQSEYYEISERSLFTMMAYFSREIDNATGGGGGQLYKGAKSDAERWERLKPILDRCRNMSYWRHNIVTYQELFGLEDGELTDDNWEAVNASIVERTADDGWYAHVTNEVCNLDTQIRNVPWFEDWEPEFFTCTLRMEQALEMHNAEARGKLEEHLDCSISSLYELKVALAGLIEQYRGRGSVGIKLAHAYRRTLHSEDVPESVAAGVFEDALVGKELTWPERKQLEDHIIFFLARTAGEMDQIFQIHTGVQGNWGNVPESNPLHLVPLIHANRGTRFDLFHAGYPYSRHIGMLAKHSANVWLNMAWMYVITMEGSRQSMNEWIDVVPGDRILGFGSDVRWPEMICSHLVMARSCLADVLATKVKRDFLSEDAAMSLVHMLLRENGVSFYGLPAG